MLSMKHKFLSPNCGAKTKKSFFAASQRQYYISTILLQNITSPSPSPRLQNI